MQKKFFLGIKALKNTYAYQLVINLLVSIKERNFDYMSILEQRILKNKAISSYFKKSILYNTLTDKEISRILHCFLLYSDLKEKEEKINTFLVLSNSINSNLSFHY